MSFGKETVAVFYNSTNKDKHSIKLSEQTRQFALESRKGKYGLETMQTQYVSVDYVQEQDYKRLSAIDKYDIAIRAIASKAPIRICAGEKISGSATLGGAVLCKVPATRSGEVVFSGISHIAIECEPVVRTGLIGLRKAIVAALKDNGDAGKERFLYSAITNIDSMVLWHRRYLEELKTRPEYKQNYNNLLKVPLVPAENFYQAVQSIWFIFAFTRLCGNLPEIGNVANLLEEYLRRDLDKGILTIEEARDILAHFIIKGLEWICDENDSVNMLHYKSLIISKESTVSSLISDITEELGICALSVTEPAFEHNEQLPCTVISLFKHECIEQGCSYLDLFCKGK